LDCCKRSWSPIRSGPLSIPIYAHALVGPLPEGDAWMALAFAFQIFFDFSGYSDIAIGCALTFGIELPRNFDAPFRAASIREFWRRWHMTLTRFLRDYLYIPLGGNRLGDGRQVAAIVVTMALAGLWHGPDGISFSGVHSTASPSRLRRCGANIFRGRLPAKSTGSAAATHRYCDGPFRRPSASSRTISSRYASVLKFSRRARVARWAERSAM